MVAFESRDRLALGGELQKETHLEPGSNSLFIMFIYVVNLAAKNIQVHT
jgi:hypothetical protein